MLDECKFRIGTEEYKKKYQTYGATTTLNADHILFKGDEVVISFIGKSVANTKIIKNESVRKMLKNCVIEIEVKNIYFTIYRYSRI